MVFIPFHKVLEKLAIMTIRSKPEDEDEIAVDSAENMLDSRFLKSPSLAIQYASNAVSYMGKLARENYKMSCELHFSYDTKHAERIREYEEIIDRTEDRLNSYLVSITDFERIGDYAFNIMEAAEYMHEKNQKLSDNAKAELAVISKAITEIIDMAVTAVEYDDLETAKKIEPLEETIDQLEYQLKNRHIERLKTGDCAIDRGIHFLDMLSDMERVADHCSNVAVHVLSRNYGKEEIKHHEYIDTIHKGDSSEYINAMNEYSNKYRLAD